MGRVGLNSGKFVAPPTNGVATPLVELWYSAKEGTC